MFYIRYFKLLTLTLCASTYLHYTEGVYLHCAKHIFTLLRMSIFVLGSLVSGIGELITKN